MTNDPERLWQAVFQSSRDWWSAWMDPFTLFVCLLLFGLSLFLFWLARWIYRGGFSAILARRDLLE